MIADYFVVRRRQLNVGALYNEAGEYRYTNGVSLVAIAAFGLAVLPNLPGFLVTIKAIAPTSVPGPLVELYNYAWFIGFVLAFVIYLALRKIAPNS
jgi:NCS1 family nucleobase:cation symporter-1